MVSSWGSMCWSLPSTMMSCTWTLLMEPNLLTRKPHGPCSQIDLILRATASLAAFQSLNKDSCCPILLFWFVHFMFVWKFNWFSTKKKPKDITLFKIQWRIWISCFQAPLVLRFCIIWLWFNFQLIGKSIQSNTYCE